MILHKNLKAFLFSPVYKHLKGMFVYRAPYLRKPAALEQFFFQKKPVERMNEEIRCVTNEGKTIKNVGK